MTTHTGAWVRFDTGVGDDNVNNDEKSENTWVLWSSARQKRRESTKNVCNFNKNKKKLLWWLTLVTNSEEMHRMFSVPLQVIRASLSSIGHSLRSIHDVHANAGFFSHVCLNNESILVVITIIIKTEKKPSFLFLRAFKSKLLVNNHNLSWLFTLSSLFSLTTT